MGDWGGKLVFFDSSDVVVADAVALWQATWNFDDLLSAFCAPDSAFV